LCLSLTFYSLNKSSNLLTLSFPLPAVLNVKSDLVVSVGCAGGVLVSSALGLR
jgi:hypothetical protein